jgi:hypothetical protein
LLPKLFPVLLISVNPFVDTNVVDVTSCRTSPNANSLTPAGDVLVPLEMVPVEEAPVLQESLPSITPLNEPGLNSAASTSPAEAVFPQVIVRTLFPPVTVLARYQYKSKLLSWVTHAALRAEKVAPVNETDIAFAPCGNPR